jgi:hypothetical protein
MRHEAILATHPNVTHVTDDRGCFDADGNSVEINEAAVEAKIAEYQAEYDAQEYARKRAVAYPSIEEQMDMQYWDSKNSTTTWIDAITSIKATYPKP